VLETAVRMSRGVLSREKSSERTRISIVGRKESSPRHFPLSEGCDFASITLGRNGENDRAQESTQFTGVTS